MNYVFADRANVNPAPQSLALYRAAGIPVIAFKATEGSSFVDPDHDAWSREAHQENLFVIHYHFAHPDLDPRQQAQFFYEQCEPVFVNNGAAPSDAYMLDIETQNGVAFPQIRNWVTTFDLQLRTLSSRNLVAYSDAAFLEEMGFASIASDAWWVAAYQQHEPVVSWVTTNWAWQFSDAKSLPGVGVGDASLLNAGSWEWWATGEAHA
jgi:GH25 family lysozyme M1 (1,4-beta-N-acetylmuramidase)